MVEKTLYIIGNGFDLHHGLRSAYSDFGKFVKANDPALYALVEDYFAVDEDFWWEFETRLAEFDYHTLAEKASDFLEPYGSEEWKDSAHHNYQFEIQQVVDQLSHGLEERFANWIRQLEIPDSSTIPRKIRLAPEAMFLNFNYTSSLTVLYRVELSRVKHIHGSAADSTAELILGHGWNPKERGSSNDGLDLEEVDVRIAQGNEIIDKYFKRTFKPTDRVIAAHQSFFESLRGVTQIIVMGHSLADVDLPYFKEITKRINPNAAFWKVSYYRDEDVPTFRSQLGKLGIPAKLVELKRLADI